MITISIANQTLEYQGKTYSISSAKNGVGEVEGSFCTPTGQFKISEKIGNNLEVGSVLVARAPTGEIFSKQLLDQNPDKLGLAVLTATKFATCRDSGNVVSRAIELTRDK